MVRIVTPNERRAARRTQPPSVTGERAGGRCRRGASHVRQRPSAPARRRGRENYQSLRIVSVAGGEFGVRAPLIQILSLTPICLWSLIRFSLNLVARRRQRLPSSVRLLAQSRPLPFQHPTSHLLLILSSLVRKRVCFY
jgi:hypothetical protein